MKIKCKCGNNIVSKDLRPTKYWEQARENWGDEEDPYIIHTSRLRSGTFIWAKIYNWGGKHFKKPMLLIAGENYFDEAALQDYEGRGCCGLHHTELYCTCSVEIGVAFLDCYDSCHIALDCSKVIRKYN